MQLSNAPSKLLLPFASAGSKNAIPVASQIGVTPGAASLTDGFPPLTRTPIAAGGVPPSGLDMNGILFSLSDVLRWMNAGGGFPYDAAFAADSNVAGYPKGARLLRSDGLGYWLNTVDGNTVNPESVTVGQAASAGWVPDTTRGVAAVTMTNANVTLTPEQYGKPIVKLTGALTANLNLIFPAIAGEWVIINGCTGNFSVTCKTASGSGVEVPLNSNRTVACDGTNVVNAGGDFYKGFAAHAGLAVGANVLTAASAGKIHTHQTAGAAATATLPSGGSIAIGTVVEFKVTSNFPLTVSPAAGDTMSCSGSALTSVVLNTGDSLRCVLVAQSLWLVDGAAVQGLYPAFAASLSANGYAKLPSGLIIQWGRIANASRPVDGSVLGPNSYPIAFPNAVLSVNAQMIGGEAVAVGSLDGYLFVKTVGLTSFIIVSGYSSAATFEFGVYWIAIGY